MSKINLTSIQTHMDKHITVSDQIHKWDVKPESGRDPLGFIES